MQLHWPSQWHKRFPRKPQVTDVLDSYYPRIHARQPLWLAAQSAPQKLAAQTPQLAPPQYGISDGTPSGLTDPGPQPNLAPPLTPPLANDDREYLRLLNQPAANTASSNSAAPIKPATTNPPAANAPAMTPINSAARPEPNASSPNIQANYQQPVVSSGSSQPISQNGSGEILRQTFRRLTRLL